MKFNQIDSDLLNTIASITEVPKGAVNIRKDGQPLIRMSSPNIIIKPKEDKPGIDVIVKPGTKNESVHIPVLVTQAGLQDLVYNTFEIGEDADVTIIAGCGIHNESHQDSGHDGIHEFIIKPKARVRYVEKHYGAGSGRGKKVLNPTTVVRIGSEAYAEMEMVQIEGVDDTYRKTIAYVEDKAHLKIVERLLTHRRQSAQSDIEISIEGKGGSAQILSRSVGKDESYQVFKASMIGKTECTGHVECDSIIMGNAVIKAIPSLEAENSEAVLTHEAAIGKIAGEQLIKLMSLGLTEEEAVNTIIEGFLR
ncbi:MAG: SufD family Fe-S cluster assembly protein [Syntrophomonadaceae bacterium]|jgi:Fe-S cluster assembly scaffold protein SufB